jgi:sigma-B regulation protein RsbU (phosphoserine phosphatase)
MTQYVVPKLPTTLTGPHPLRGFYLIGMIAITVGIVMVFLLNLSTPFTLERMISISEGVRQSYNLQLPSWLIMFLRFLIILVVAYLPILIALYVILRPVDTVIRMLKEGIMPEKPLWDLAGRRLLNLPYRCVPISIGLYIVIPALIFHYAYFSGMMSYQATLIFSIRSSMVGLVASTIASHRLESYSRRLFIPVFFPEGGLSGKPGIVTLSIRKRIKVVNMVGSLVPLIILLVTLFTLQWELEDQVISARAYGKGVLIFACVLMAWVLVAAAQMNLLVSRSITDPLHDIIRVLKMVRQGRFNVKAPVVSNDEIGYTAETINEMTDGLQERDRIRLSLELAQEVQQNLLPKEIPEVEGLQIGVVSEYCDETGGDYYDFIELGGSQTGKLGIVLGDVAGHGVSSALLMATARAFFRQRALQGGDPQVVVTDVNQLLSSDIADSGQFMTLFYTVVHPSTGTVQWVRAGHEPGCLYDPSRDAYVELKGEGIPLGVESDWQYIQQQVDGFAKGQVLVLGTDGIWEARNSRGDFFGKQRLEDLVRENAHRSAQEIADLVSHAHQQFRAEQSPDDDVTLLIVKVV